MKRTLFAAFSLSFLLAWAPSTANAGTSGDNPLTPIYFDSGNMDAQLLVAASPGTTSFASSWTLSGLPAGATIEQAYVHTNWWGTPGLVDLSFNGGSAITAGPFTIDAGYSLGGYRWDVTSSVSGNGTYTFNITNSNLIYGASLFVAYSHPSLPLHQIRLNDGAEDLAGATSTTPFIGVAAGASRLLLFTQADDTDSGEEILFNGAVVGGPIDANTGNYASQFDIPVTTISGLNTASIMTPSDQFGWHIAALVSPVVPEPAGITLVALGMIGLWPLTAHRARRQR